MILKLENIFENLNLKSKEEVFSFVAKNLEKNGTITDVEDVIKKLEEREQITSTGMEAGIAIPHGKIKELNEPIVTILKTGDVMGWQTLDNQPINLIFCILVPENGGEEHLKILSKLAKFLAKEENINGLKLASRQEMYDTLTKELNSTEEEKHVGNNNSGGEYYVGVTKCAVGIAHTYVMAEKLEKTAKELNINIKVETQGAAGTENIITDEDVKNASYVLICADAEITGKDRFNGKKVLEVPIKKGLKNTEKLFEDVKNEEIKHYNTSEASDGESSGSGSVLKAVLNGVSHMIPFVVLGGLMIALSLSIGGEPTADGLVIPDDSFWMTINQIGSIGFYLMIPILAGYIASSIGGRSALAPAMISAIVSNSPDILHTSSGTGFLGALLVGILTGYLVKYINKIKIPKVLLPVMPIFVIPIVGTLVMSLGFIYIFGYPITVVTEGLNNFLTFLSSNPSTQILLGITLGSMIAVDTGGVINKTAFLFGVASITSGQPEIMGAVAAAIAVPPLTMGVSTLIAPKKYTDEEKQSGIAALLMGCIGITEGAIPFSAADPKRVIPSIMIGSAVASTLALMFGITDVVPHGGPIVGVLGATNNILLYFLAIAIGTAVGALIISFWKKNKEVK